MRTLIISDLHLGNRAQHDVLRLPVALALLLQAVDESDRLVLLGDLVELMGRSPRRSLATAEPVLRAIGRRLGAEREALIVPGNHDGPLVRAWARTQGKRLSVACAVEPDASRALWRLVSWLAPARVSVHYPGVWLADRVWATHGHYLDRYLWPHSAFGVLRSARSGRSRRWERPIDYERGRHERGRRRSRGGRESPLTRWLHQPLAMWLECAAGVVRAVTLPVPRLLMDARLAPLTAAAIDQQMQRASLPAMARVVQRLGVEADWVVFGHVHRLGPRRDDRPDRWRPAAGSRRLNHTGPRRLNDMGPRPLNETGPRLLDTGPRLPDTGPRLPDTGPRLPDTGPRLLNTGSWLYEPLLVDRAQPPHPYWPGGAVLLEPDREPRAVGLLDGLTAADLRVTV